jgi:hypothetical protein
MPLHEGRQAIFLPARTPDLPASREGTHPARISDMRDTVTPIGSASDGSQPTARKAQFPSGNRRNQEAKAVSRKAGEKHNPTDRAVKGDGDTQTENRADVVLVNHPKNDVMITNRGKS